MNSMEPPAIWFPAIRAGSGADVFTERLAEGLRRRGMRAEIAWLPSRAEYAPWCVQVPRPPEWANIVHVNTWLPERFLPQGLPVVATMHHCVHDRSFRPYKSFAQAVYHRAYIKAVERKVLYRAASVVAVSTFTADATRKVFGSIPICVIPNGVDLGGAFQPAKKRAEHKPFRLLFVGNWSRRKGVDLLTPIMERLGPGFELACVGVEASGRGRAPDNMGFRGRLPSEKELAMMYRDSDALLFPSRLEGFGLVALEAQACGLPVIATNGSALTETIEDGVTGILCAADDIDDFAQAARRLAGDSELWARMSAAARKRVESRFSLDVMVEAYISVYESYLAP